MARLAGFLFLWMSLAVGWAGSAAAQTWSLYKSADGRFEVQLPGPPKEAETLNEMGDRTFNLEVQLSPNQVFLVTATQFLKGTRPDEAVPKMLKDMQVAVERRFAGSKLLQAAAMDHGPWKGRTFTLRIEGGKLIYQARLYWAGNRLYQTVAVTDPASASLPMVGYFMDSFQILKE